MGLDFKQYFKGQKLGQQSVISCVIKIKCFYNQSNLIFEIAHFNNTLSNKLLSKFILNFCEQRMFEEVYMVALANCIYVFITNVRSRVHKRSLCVCSIVHTLHVSYPLQAMFHIVLWMFGLVNKRSSKTLKPLVNSTQTFNPVHMNVCSNLKSIFTFGPLPFVSFRPSPL